MTSFVMAGLVPAIHVFLADMLPRRGCPAQGHGCPVQPSAKKSESRESLNGVGAPLRILAGRENTAEFLDFGPQHIPRRLARLSGEPKNRESYQ